jgi:hypothetical protein
MDLECASSSVRNSLNVEIQEKFSMNKMPRSAVTVFLLIVLIFCGDVRADSVVGTWVVSLTLTVKVWRENGRLKSREKRHYINNFEFFDDGTYQNLSQPDYEHGTWRQARARLRLFPDFAGPMIINGPYNSITVKKWYMRGRQDGNRIFGKYLMRYNIIVADAVSGVFVLNRVKISGTFAGAPATAAIAQDAAVTPNSLFMTPEEVVGYPE